MLPVELVVRRHAVPLDEALPDLLADVLVVGVVVRVHFYGARLLTRQDRKLIFRQEGNKETHACQVTHG